MTGLAEGEAKGPVTTPTETLRAAAALMRRRAEAASVHSDATTGAPLAWVTGGLAHAVFDLGGENIVRQARVASTPHIASWHPAVALAVADLLERQAECIEKWGDFTDIEGLGDANALAVAVAYLGGDA